MKNDFFVSVRCISYNHASYIEDCMNGFTMQETNFPYVCVIDDDASTDGEPEVITNYLAEHFDIDDKDVVRREDTNDYRMIFAQHKTNKNCFFAVYFLKYNHYSIRKSREDYVAEYVDGAKYIAICEGDDYWTDPLKLQKQVGLMEIDYSVGLVYAKAKKVENKTGKVIKIIGEKFDTVDDLLFKNRIPTLTACYRKDLYDLYKKTVANYMQEMSLGDYPMWPFFKINSKVVFINKVCAVYRVLEESASHSRSSEKMIRFHQDIYNISLFYANSFSESLKNKEKVLFKIMDRYEWSKYRVFQVEIFPERLILSNAILKKLSIRHKLIYLLNRCSYVRAFIIRKFN